MNQIDTVYPYRCWSPDAVSIGCTPGCNAGMGMAVTAAQTYYGAHPESEWPGMVRDTWATALLSRGLVGVLSHGVHTRQTLE